MKIFGKDAYMYSDVISLYRGRDIAKLLSDSPEATLKSVIDALNDDQVEGFNLLSQDWIDDLEKHPDPVARLHHYLTTLECEGQQFRSSFPWSAFPSKKKSEDRFEAVIGICDENWMIWKKDIPA